MEQKKTITKTTENEKLAEQNLLTNVVAKIENKKTENKVDFKSKQALKNTKQFKEKYFEYYDDIKSNTHDVYDW